MTNLIIIGVIITLLNIWTLYLIYTESVVKFRTLYPDLHVPKEHWSTSMLAKMKLCFIVTFPVVHLVAFILLLIYSDKICDSTVQSYFEACIKKTVNEEEE